jgi:hypothetical protein
MVRTEWWAVYGTLQISFVVRPVCIGLSCYYQWHLVLLLNKLLMFLDMSAFMLLLLMGTRYLPWTVFLYSMASFLVAFLSYCLLLAQ